MELTVRPGKYPSDWRLEFDSDNWSTAAKDVLRGIRPQAGALIGDVLSMSDRSVETGDSITAILNERLTEFELHRDIRIPERGIETIGDALTVTGDILSLSFWCFSSGLTSLERNDIGLAVRAFQMSASFHGRYTVLMDLMLSEIDAPPTGPAHALASRSDQVMKPEWQAHCRAILESGKKVKVLDDLLNAPGYPADVTKIMPPTLRKWARECGIEFKAGRPSAK